MATENSNVNLYINTKGAEASLKNLQSDATKLKNELRLLSPTSQEFADKAKQFQEVNNRINELNGNLRGTNNSLTALKGEVKNTLPFFGQFQGARDKLMLVKNAAVENATAMNLLKVSMAAIPIFALIAGITVLIQWFKKNDDAAKFWDGTLKALTNTMDFLVARMDALLRGDFSAVFKDFGKGLSDAAKAGYETANALDELNSFQRRAKTEIAEYDNQIKLLTISLKNKNLSEKEAMGIVDQILALDTKRLKTETDLINKEIESSEKNILRKIKEANATVDLSKKTTKQILDDLEDGKLRQGAISDDELDAFEDLQTKKIELIGKSADLREKIDNKLDLLDKRFSAERQKREAQKLKDEEKKAKDLLDLQKYIEETRLSIIKDSHAKELAELDSKFESEYAKYGEDQNALNVMTEKYRLDKQAITDKYNQLENEKTLADAQLGFDLLAEQTKNNFLSGQITEEQYQESIYQLQLGYETKKLQLLQDSGTAKQLELEKQQGVILQLQSSHAKNEVALNAAKNQKKLDNERATSQQVGNVLSSLGNFTSTLMRVQGKNSKELAVANKVIAGIELAANSARAISAATASGASLPFPANIAAIAAGVIAVVSNVVQATAMLNEGNDGPDVNIQSAPSYSGSGFKVGGFTGSGNSNDIAGPAHYNEYVIPDYVVANPQFESTIQMLEMARQGKSVQSVPNSPSTSQNVSFPSQMRLSKDDLDYLADKLNDKKVILSNSEFDINQKDRTKVRATNQY